MIAMLALAVLAQVDSRQDEYERGPEFPTEVGGLLFGVQSLRTRFGADSLIDDGSGVLVEAHLRLGEEYYYKVSAAWWETEEEFPAGRDVELSSWAVGMGGDLLFGASPWVALDGGVGVGVLDVESDIQSDRAFFWQIEGALRLRLLPHVGLRFSAIADYVNLHFNTPTTEHMTHISLGAGLEITF